MNSVIRLNLEQKKVAASASLFSILILVTLANINLLSQKETVLRHQDRAIASIENDHLQYSQEAAEENSRLVLNRLQNSDRSIASLGQEPDMLEKLRYGYFEGKYAVRTQAGKIRQIEFVESDSGDRPKYVADVNEFVKEHQNLFEIQNPKLKEIAKTSSENSSETTTYNVVNESNNEVEGSMVLKTDEFGRLFSMEYQPK